MKKGFSFLLKLFTALALAACSSAAAFGQDFYKDKTIRFIVGFSAGGGFDTYTRVIGHHIGKHIPGNPTIIVENMPGAGSMIAANRVFKAAKPDGLTGGHFIGSLFMAQLLGRAGIEFDARKFEYIGAPVKDNPVCTLTKASGITSVEKWMASKIPVKLGGLAPGNTADDHPNILKATLGLPIQIVSGYKGANDIRLAAETGEVAGLCVSWEGTKTASSKALESGDVVVVLQMLPQPHPDLPLVPLAINFAKTEEARQLIQLGIHNINAIIRPYVLPPRTPKDRVQVLRKAFMDTMMDPEFLADAKKSRMDLDPLSGEELERTVAGLFKLSPSVVAKLKEILGAK